MKEGTRLSFWQATSIIAGYGIGGGVLAVPWLVSLNGLWLSLAILAAAYAASLALHLLIAELAAGDGTGSQIVELFRKYLFTGRFGALATWVFFAVMGIVFLANLAAYVAGGDETLGQALGLRSPWGAVIFYVGAASVAAFGLKALGRAEQWAVAGMSALFAVLAVATIAARIKAGGPAAAWEAAVGAPLPSIGKPMALFGMAMFCYAAFFSVPQAAAGLADRPRLIGKAVAAGLAINAALIALVTALSLAASDEVTQIATVGWAKSIGPWAEAAGAVFVVLAMMTSYWSISFALSTIIEERLKLGRIPAWLIATAPTLALALAGAGGFLDFMRTAGGGIAIIVAVLFLPAYYRYRRTRQACAILPKALDTPLTGVLVALAYVAMAIGSLAPM